jgi:hypothetical protein
MSATKRLVPPPALHEKIIAVKRVPLVALEVGPRLFAQAVINAWTLAVHAAQSAVPRDRASRLAVTVNELEGGSSLQVRAVVTWGETLAEEVRRETAAVAAFHSPE